MDRWNRNDDRRRDRGSDRRFERGDRRRDLSYGTPANSGRQGYTATGDRNERWGARDSHLGRGDYGFEAQGGYQGAGSDGSQGYGVYNDERRERDVSRDLNREERHYGIPGGAGFGVYDIGGQGAQGYQRLSSGNYDDIGFGQRHWGRGEFDESGRDSRGYTRRDESSHGHHHESLMERVGEAVGRFFGKGPKGYRRSDDRIKEDVSEALYRHPDIDASDIEVQVADGVVTLSGTVDSRRTKRLAEMCIENLSGVQDVNNHLRSKQFSSTSDATRSTRDEPSKHH